MTLRDIWDSEQIAQNIIAVYEDCKPETEATLTEAEAKSIERVVYYTCHSLMECPLILKDSVNSFRLVSEEITHDIIELVTNYRTFKHTLNFEKSGLQHNQIQHNPMDNDANDNGFIVRDDNILFSNLALSNDVIQMLNQQKSPFNRIYRELKKLVQTIFY